MPTRRRAWLHVALLTAAVAVVAWQHHRLSAPARRPIRARLVRSGA